MPNVEFVRHTHTHRHTHYGDMKLRKFQFPLVTDNFIFPLMSSNYVHTYIAKLPNSRNLDSLNFDNYTCLLRTASSVIAPSLTHILVFNLSLCHGTVPSCWKLPLRLQYLKAKVTKVNVAITGPFP